jgi:hypothetical protein
MQPSNSTPVGSIVDEIIGQMKGGETLAEQCARIQTELQNFFLADDIITAVRAMSDSNLLFNNVCLTLEEIGQIRLTPQGLFIPVSDGINLPIDDEHVLDIQIGEASMIISYDLLGSDVDWMNWNFIMALADEFGEDE